MSKPKYMTMRHIETVRNYLDLIIKELIKRQEKHDQTKLESPEVECFEIYTLKLKDCTYGSEEYKRYMKEMKPAIEHHNKENRHHPEYFKNGIQDMTLIDLLEMLCDWKAASLRHADGNIMRSIKINQSRFNYTNELFAILENTARWLNKNYVFHKANES